MIPPHPATIQKKGSHPTSPPLKPPHLTAVQRKPDGLFNTSTPITMGLQQAEASGKKRLVAQRSTIYKAEQYEAIAWQKLLFEQRCSDGTAKSGVHNYAIDCYTKRIERSGTSCHAEIFLLALSKASIDEEILLVSEYKPCPSCQQVIADVEGARKVQVRILYFLDFESKGDGDTTITRNYYKKLGFLTGGGDYVYDIADQWQLVDNWPK